MLSFAEVQARWQQRLVFDLSLVLLAFAGAAGLAHWTGQRLLGAICRIALAIQRIKNGEFATRLPHTDHNELGTLQEGVNLLADTLERGKARLDRELAQVRGEYQHTLEALQVQTQAAEQANQAKSLFLAKVSHEMRTPLYSIQGLIEQRLKIACDGTEARTLQTILTATTTLYRHISDILDFTQLEKGKYSPVFAPLEVWAELETIIVSLEPLLVQRGLYLDVIVTPEVPTVLESDGKALRVILANLLANAVKYTETGGIVVRVDLAPPDDHAGASSQLILRLQVMDTGCGIPAHRREAIFAPFEQVDDALNRRYPGTGLGLSIVKGYCDLLDGHINVISTPESGSTFTVTLPFRLPDETTSGRSLPAEGIPPGRRALVVDERPSFRASVSARLASLGVTVTEWVLSLAGLVGRSIETDSYDVLVVQDLAIWPDGERRAAMARLREWAPIVITLERHGDVDGVGLTQDAALMWALWSGATRSQWHTVLAQAFRKVEPMGGAAPGLVLPSPPPSPLPLLGKTLLVVEDYDINRMIMVNQLRENGAQVREAEDGDTAVALAAEPGIDLILMDIQMPGKDGIAAIQEIRQAPTGDRLPILGFTASADKPTHERILAAGADRVLTKPISETDLVRAVRRALRRGRSVGSIQQNFRSD
ncbi:MAG: response regulator [Candidatus Competibacteraceae bacterium]|nr:response regulator [Candidatus Competibacteraceae bacterium]